MTWYPECAATPEDDGPNWTPPTTGNLMQEQKTKLTRLREAEAGQLVAREARLFHERKALKYGVHTSRGMAHFKASMGYGNTREADGRLQEMFAQGGDPSAELPPKAVMKASKAAMKFHQGQAEKHGLNTPVGQAHVAAMQHHQAIHGKAKGQHQQMQQMKMQQQAAQPRSPKVVKPPTQGQPQAQPQGQPMMASTEGGPGSGRHKGPGSGERPSSTSGPGTRGASGKRMTWAPMNKDERAQHRGVQSLIKQGFDSWKGDKGGSTYYAHKDGRVGKVDAKGNVSIKAKKESEAAPGHSSKQSPVPVPKKSDQPSEDIRQNKPPVALSPQDANKPGALRQLQQNETAGAHAGMIRAGGPGSGPRAQGGSSAKIHNLLTKAGFKLSGSSFHPKDERSKGDKGSPGSGLYKHSDGRSVRTGPEGGSHSWTSFASGQNPFKSGGSAGGWGAKSLANHLSGSKKESVESRIRNFAREGGGRGPYDNLDCTLPSKIKDQMKQNIVFRGKRTDERNKREAGYVAPRYDKSHPEGFTDKRYSDMKNGVEAGWPDKQRKMHSKMAKKSAPRVMESNRQRFPREAAIDLREFYGNSKKDSRRGEGWKNGVSFTPTAPKVEREEVNLIIKEF